MHASDQKTEGSKRLAPVAWSLFGSTSELMDLVSEYVFAFDDGLRVVCANAAFEAAFGTGREAAVGGRSFGAVLCCRHAVNGLECGGSEACSVCGWFIAADAARRGEASNQECRLLTCSGIAFDFMIRTAPVSVRGCGLCSLKDVSASKRLRVLERSVFHDVTNLAVGIKGLLEILDIADAVQTDEYVQLIHGSAKKMTHEILRLRTLREAENGDLVPCCGRVSAGELVQEVIAGYSEEASARHVTVCADEAADVHFETDRMLAHLVLCCLVLNAIEASKRGDRVTVGYSEEDASVVFRVSNAHVLASDVRLKMFERSFSTKGAGKGVGAYGAKLIAERFLKGRLSFVSQASEGTVFVLSLPLSLSGSGDAAGCTTGESSYG